MNLVSLSTSPTAVFASATCPMPIRNACARWPLQITEIEGQTLEEGVYLAVSGPSFETPAEIRAFRTMGATLVGMSTVPETIVARHMGIEVLGISCVTNLAAGLGATPLSHAEVFEAGKQVERKLADLLERLAMWIAALVDAES